MAAATSTPVSYVIDAAGGVASMLLANLRNNGLTDIITSGYAAVSVLLNQGHGAFKEGIWTSVQEAQAAA